MYIDLTPCRNALYPLLPGLSRNGKLVVLGGTMDNIPVAPLQLIGQRKTIQGWPSGTGRDSQVRASNRPPLRLKGWEVCLCIRLMSSVLRQSHVHGVQIYDARN